MRARNRDGQVLLFQHMQHAIDGSQADAVSLRAQLVMQRDGIARRRLLDQQRQQRDMGRLARAGFSQQICQTVLEITDPQSAEQQLAEASTLPEPGSLG